MKISPIEVAWSAGLLEGEACFDIRASYCLKRDPNNKQVRVIVEMKDEDVLLELQSYWGGSVRPVKCKSKQRENWSPYYKWLLSSRGEIEHLLKSIQPFMSERRSGKIQEILHFIKEKK